MSQRQRDHYRVDSEKQKKKRSSHKAVESVLRTEGSLWWERFEEKVGLEPGVEERGTYGVVAAKLDPCDQVSSKSVNIEE